MSAALDEFPAWQAGGDGSAASRQQVLQRLKEADWPRILAVLPKKTATRAQHFPRTRNFIEATLWVVDTGLQWRQLPTHYGSWRSNYVRFLRWAQQGTWTKIVAALGDAGLGACLQARVDAYLFESDAFAATCDEAD